MQEMWLAIFQMDTNQEQTLIMLIKFQSRDAAAFSMLLDDARPLIRGMGHGEKLEGAVSGENLNDALAQLESALRQAAEEPMLDAQTSEDVDPDAEEPPVAINVRAVPLLEMMRKAQENESYVMWQPE